MGELDFIVSTKETAADSSAHKPKTIENSLWTKNNSIKVDEDEFFESRFQQNKTKKANLSRPIMNMFRTNN
jgi:hypothetical protein